MPYLPRPDSNGLTSSDIVSGATLYIVLAFLTVAFYNVLELTVYIYTTFKQYKGLYFWSMVIASWGIALNGVGFILKYLKPFETSDARVCSTVLVLIGWCTMVTGQSMVLFSRLHLLVHDRFTIRLVLGMIVFNAFICHPPIFVLFSLVNSANYAPYVVAYSVYEKFQLAVFSIQELIISVIYIKESARFLPRQKPSAQASNTAIGRSPAADSRKVMRWLITINVLIVVLDISILCLEFAGFYDVQTSWKVLVYSVKLKLEFSILNKLIAVVKARNPDLFDSDGMQLQVLSPAKALGDGPTVQRLEPKVDDLSRVSVDAILPIKSPVGDSYVGPQGGSVNLNQMKRQTSRSTLVSSHQ